MMRVFGLCIVLLMALTAPSAAQDSMQTMMALNQALDSDSPTARQQAISQIERQPGAISPFAMYNLPKALNDLGRADDALRWSYFVQIRILTDLSILRPAFADTTGAIDVIDRQLSSMMAFTAPSVTAEHRRAIFEEAVRFDQRTPRTYSLSPFGGMVTWPDRDTMNAARFAAVGRVRTRMEADVTREAMIQAIDSQIAASGVADEANALIPETLRVHIHAVHSVRLPDDCAATGIVGATPNGARQQAFAMYCRAHPLSLQTTAATVHWFSADTFEPDAAMSAPTSPVWDADIVVRDGEPFALYRAAVGLQQGSLLLQGRNGSIVTLGNGGPNSWFVNSISPSGRLALRNVGNGAEVIDLASGSVVFRRVPPPTTPTSSPDRLRENYSFIIEEPDGQVQLVGLRRTMRSACTDDGGCATEVIAWSSRTDAIRAVTIPHAMPNLVGQRVGNSRILIGVSADPGDMPSPAPSVQTYDNLEAWRAAHPDTDIHPQDDMQQRRGAIVDVNSMRVVWTGAYNDAPRSADAPSCGLALGSPAWMASMPYPNGDGPKFQLSAAGGSAVLENSQRQALTGCAVTGDGRHLVILAPPFAHIYEVEAAGH